MCPKLGLSFPTHPQHGWQRLSLSPGFWAGPLATGPEHGLPGAWSPGLPASVLGPSLAGLFPPGLGLAFSPLTYEWIPGKGSGPPAVTGLTHQHTVSGAECLPQRATQEPGVPSKPLLSVLGSDLAAWSLCLRVGLRMPCCDAVPTAQGPTLLGSWKATGPTWHPP